MQIVFLSKFSKDLEKIKSNKLKTSVLGIVESLEKTNELKEMPNLKKMKGHNTAYRIRIGEYRLGLFIDNNELILARLVHRKDIYKFFP